MKRKIRFLVIQAFTIGIYALLIYLSILIGVLWLSASLVTLWTSLLITAFYRQYHLEQSKRKRKKQINSQIQANSYFDNLWYRPADSTKLGYQRKKFQAKKKGRKE